MAVIEWIVAIFLLVGSGFALVGSLGLAWLPDFYTRLHGPTKASTMGVGCVLIGSMVWISVQTDSVSLHEILVTLFLFITAPISAHMVAKAAIHLQLQRHPKTRGRTWPEQGQHD
ncbi:Na+/H+ antiporter subunit G [Marinobacteraceae bacterium S3BR75-40.1]